MSCSKNHHRPPAVAAPISGDVGPPWSSLPMDLVQLVGWQVLSGDLLDYVRFRAVCTHWWSSTVCPLGRGIVEPRFHPRRWMIMPEGHGLHPGDGKKRFFSLSSGSFVRIRIPLLSNHHVLLSVEGLLLLRPRNRDVALMLVVHPFTGDFVVLPPLMPLLESYWEEMAPRAGHFRFGPLNFAASLSVSVDGTVALMIAHQYVPQVLFATTKDKEWRVTTWNLTPLSKPISLQGKLYILEPSATCNSGQQILRVDPPLHEHPTIPSSLMPPKLIVARPKGEYHELFGLAECDSDILVIGFEDNLLADKLVVYKLGDLATGKVSPIQSIGGNTIFLDIKRSTDTENSSIFISRSMTSSYMAMPTIESDTIVRLRQGYPWQYHLGTGKWSQLIGGCVKNVYNMAEGCECGLIYHTYNCCHCTDKEEIYVFKF
ncbi:unnamed protein product [Alopecurus aequalis]